ncbi:hypothetical protein GN956_G23784 [Arapaima gigas]
MSTPDNVVISPVLQCVSNTHLSSGRPQQKHARTLLVLQDAYNHVHCQAGPGYNEVAPPEHTLYAILSLPARRPCGVAARIIAATPLAYFPLPCFIMTMGLN